MKGRKKLPTALKQARGTLRKGRTNPNEPDFQKVDKLPPPPNFLAGEGLRIYEIAGAELLEKGVLTTVSMPLFIMFCNECETYFRAIHEIKTLTVCSGEKRNPLGIIAKDSLQNALKLGAEFGLSPASAGRVVAKNENFDPKMDFLRKLSNRTN